MGDNGIAVLGDDMGDGMQCADHPYRSNQGGICAYCLQERLGKLVSSKSNPFFPLPISPSPSSPPHLNGPPPLATATAAAGGSARSFLSKTKLKNSSNTKVKSMASSSSTTSSSSSAATGSYSSVLALKRSKSVAPRPLGGLPEIINGVADSPRKKSFWSFLYHPAAAAAAAGGGGGGAAKRRSISTASGGADADLKQEAIESHVSAAEESPGGSQASSSFGRKVSRSRSVGCGSRSFSGDFLERISTGFGDCTLRRVESHREGKQKCAAAAAAAGGGGGIDDEQQRFKCGGLFGGFGMIITEASEEFENAGRRMSTSARLTAPHGRHRGWGWASLASPMRAWKPTATGSTAPSTTIISTTAGSSSSNSTVNNSIDKLSCNSSMLEVGS